MENVLKIIELASKAFIFAFILTMILKDTRLYTSLEDKVVKATAQKTSVAVVNKIPVEKDIVTDNVVLYDILSQDGKTEIVLNGTEITKKSIIGVNNFFENIKENDIQELLNILPEGNYERTYTLDTSGKIKQIRYIFQ